MGKIILCAGGVSKTPYVFAMSGTSVYSIEEMSYYLYTHIYEINEDFLDATLINWIRYDIAMEGLADKLETMRKNRNNLKDIIVTILCSNDYYSEKEIKELIIIIDQIKDLPTIKKRKIRGDYYLKYGMYYNAAQEYEKILTDRDINLFQPEEYGNLLHNKGIIKAKTTSYLEAAQCFKEAYNLNHNEESLQQYMLVLLLLGEEQRYNEEVEKHGLLEDFTAMLYEKIAKAEEEAKLTNTYQSIESLKRLYSSEQAEQYRERVTTMLEELKALYRMQVEG